LPSPPLSRRKKNPSTISRSRSFASSAEGSTVVGGGSRVSKTGRGREWAERSGSIAMSEAKWTPGPWIGDPG
jgi:hypothetical protein